MYIVCETKAGAPFLILRERYFENYATYRKMVCRTVYPIGPLADFDDGLPNYLQRLRESFKNGNPLIEALQQYAPVATTANSEEPETETPIARKNIGYLILQGIYNAFGISELLRNIRNKNSDNNDPGNIFELLLYSQILSPGSKLAAFSARENYIPKFTKITSPITMFQTIDFIGSTSATIQTHIRSKLAETTLAADPNIHYYDATLYGKARELDYNKHHEDYDPIDRAGLEDENVLNELVPERSGKLALILDSFGLPEAFKVLPAYKMSKILRPPIERYTNDTQTPKQIIVSDGGLNYEYDLAHIVSINGGYIVSKSLKNSEASINAWAFNDDDYKCSSKNDFMYKSQIIERSVKCDFGKSFEMVEKIICIKSDTHFLNQYEPSVDGRETAQSLSISNCVKGDNSKYYYTILTSEVDTLDEEIIAKYRQLSRFGDSLQIFKNRLGGRRRFVHDHKNLNAHFAICYIGLLIIRIIQYKVSEYLKSYNSDSDYVPELLSFERIKKALYSCYAAELDDEIYELNEISDDLGLILVAFGVELPTREITMADIEKIKATLKETCKF
ncbi:MAG: hypothetical protein LBE09_08255 [Christensenellaceae bacterium]|jgi:hypothetical protein|nr:hypothetical protein [Christensenellaceae bacterium]